MPQRTRLALFTVIVAVTLLTSSAFAIKVGAHYAKGKGTWKWNLSGTKENGKVKGDLYIAPGKTIDGNFTFDNGCDGTYSVYDKVKIGPNKYITNKGYVLLSCPDADDFYEYDVSSAKVIFKKNNKGKPIAIAQIGSAMTTGPTLGSTLNLKLTNTK